MKVTQARGSKDGKRPRGQVHLVDLDSAGAGAVEHKRGAEPRRGEGQSPGGARGEQEGYRGHA